MKRWATSTFDISSVKIATGVSWRIARFAATPSAKADLPMPRRLTSPLPAAPLDLLPDRRQPAKSGHVAHDPRVVAGVRCRGHEGRELVDAFLAADLREVTAFVELVGDGDRVDGLSVLVELDRREIDARVRLAVEVAGIDDAARCLDRRPGQHHRPENRLLGVEILRRERSRRRHQPACPSTASCRGGRGAACPAGTIKRAVNSAVGASATVWKTARRPTKGSRFAGMTEHTFA